ncbi:MAG: hypothetical protein D6B28_11815 [Gammaproteobacteria bacterium]|nr:MAG: hypothetical protein D6B28_11815 [Gammaproteobacteria bacterium]
MNNLSLVLGAIALMSTSSCLYAQTQVNDEASLNAAIAAANADSSIRTIVFEKDADITLTAPVIYNGSQKIQLIGNGAIIDGAAAGSFVLDDDLTAVTKDGTLIFNTQADVRINGLTVINSATRGIVVNIPETATGDDISISMQNVNVIDSALFGVHIDDNADEFDDGATGSDIGINLYINGSVFTGNGTGAIDFDGFRVDERAEGNINALIVNTEIDGNGGDGMELDEGGNGNVKATLINTSFSANGFYNEEDLDDGLDIDEAGAGDIIMTMINGKVNDNMDEGLDLDEENDGDVKLSLIRVEAFNNADEGIKVDEEDAGDIKARMIMVDVAEGGDDGIQFTEIGEGDINAKLINVTAENNKKYGIKMEQWVEEDEEEIVEEAGSLKVRNVVLAGNGKGDEIKTHNIVVAE